MTPKAKRLYHEMLSQRKHVVTHDGRCLIIYSRPPEVCDIEAYTELLEGGLVKRAKVGMRSVFELGVFSEALLTQGKAESTVGGEIELKISAYTEQGQKVVRSAFRMFAQLRRSNAVAENILLSELNYYEQYPQDVVIEALRIYIEQNCSKSGKGEAYARGIIRGVSREREMKKTNKPSKQWVDWERSAKRKQELSLGRKELVDLLVKKRINNKEQSLSELQTVFENVKKEVQEIEKTKGEGYWLFDNTLDSLRKEVSKCQTQ